MESDGYVWLLDAGGSKTRGALTNGHLRPDSARKRKVKVKEIGENESTKPELSWTGWREAWHNGRREVRLS